MKLRLEILENSVAIHRLSALSPIPEVVYGSRFYAICRTGEDLSIVCDSQIRLEAEKHEPGWRIIKVLGPLDFSQTGILASLTVPLAEAGISIFSQSTFDTDYILVKSADLERARHVLAASGIDFL